MKRPAATSSHSLAATCPSSDQEQSPRINGVRGTEFQSMLDGFEEEESGHVSEKKRRLSVEQVKVLEKNFEVENKLEPERKLKLAKQLGLHPRQVAIWFQNRRARCKTKQLERDYGVLKTNYDNLKLTYQTLQNDSQALLKEIQELKTKLREENSENALIEQIKPDITVKFSVPPASEAPPAEALLFPDFKDGLSDSDSSAILNEDYSPTVAVSSPGVLQNHYHHHFMTAAASPSATAAVKPTTAQYHQQTQMFPKMEEHNFFTGEEACNFFSDEQAPTLHWWRSMAA